MTSNPFHMFHTIVAARVEYAAVRLTLFIRFIFFYFFSPLNNKPVTNKPVSICFTGSVPPVIGSQARAFISVKPVAST